MPNLAAALAEASRQGPLSRRAYLKAICRGHRPAFCLRYFPERFGAPPNDMHRDFLARHKQPWSERETPTRMVDAAPRGGAKSTIVSFADLVHDAVFGFELFVPIISTTFRLAEGLVKDLHRVFTDPEAYADLHADYGPFRVEGTQTDFIVKVPGQDPRGCRFAAFSFGGSIRGEKHNGIRPTKIVVDDGEHPERVRSPDQRDKTWSYLTKDILKAGDKFTVFRVVGTNLHPSGMLATLLQSPGWTSTRWRSVIAWPARMDLWQDCRRLWADLTDPDREDTALRFYGRHRAEMDAGAEVLWPDHESLWDLMVLLWTDGDASFNSEKQNEPRDPTRQVFDVPGFRRCRFDGLTITTAEGRTVRLRDCAVGIWHDPAVGKNALKGDYSAHAMVARDSVGYRYVLRAEVHREPPHKQRERTWSYFGQLGPAAKYGTEDNGFQVLYLADFDREREERQKAGKAWALDMRGYTSTQNKEARISRLEPDAVNGWIQFAEDLPVEVLEQFRDFPTGAHDDGPDAIERCDWMLSAAMPTVQSGWLPG